MARPNVFTDELEPFHQEAGFKSVFAPVGRQAGGERLGGSVYLVEPGCSSGPYHFHRANEELLVVLEGTPTLRTPEDERELAPGSAVAFRAGPVGAHQVINRSGKAVRYVIFSTARSPEVVHYPDSGKVAAWAMPQEGDEGFPRFIFREADAVDYFEGEQAPS